MEMERKGKKKKVEWNWKNEGRKKKAPKMGDSDGKIRLRGCHGIFRNKSEPLKYMCSIYHMVKGAVLFSSVLFF